MAMGCGFTLGPFFGGILSTISYSLPFLFTFGILLLNFLLALLFFKETLFRSKEAKITPKMAVNNLKKAFLLKETRITFLASFIHCFGWSYFFEFVPLYLIKYYSYSTLNLGVFYATAGAFYALCTGVLIQPTLRLFRNEFLIKETENKWRETLKQMEEARIMRAAEEERLRQLKQEEEMMDRIREKNRLKMAEEEKNNKFVGTGYRLDSGPSHITREQMAEIIKARLAKNTNQNM
jgi:hypothetical protein